MTGTARVARTRRIMSNCGVRMSGVSARPALYSSTISSRKVGPGASKATARAEGRCSRTKKTSIEVKPWTALVTVPSAVARSSGSAKKARKARDMPSRSSSGPEPGGGSLIGSGLQFPVDHLLRHVSHPGPRPHRGALDERERVRLAQAAPFHQELLGLLDLPTGLDLVLGPLGTVHPAGLKPLDLLVDRPVLPALGQHPLDRRQKLLAAEWLDQVGGHPGVAGVLDEVPLTEGGEHEHGHLVARRDLAGGTDAVHAGHLDVQDGEVGLVGFDQGDGFVAAPRFPHDVIAGRKQDLLEIEADDGLVLGDDHSRRRPLADATLAQRPVPTWASSSSWRRSRSATVERSASLAPLMASAWRRTSTYSWAASGVSETSERSRASSASSATTASCSFSTASSSRARTSRVCTSRMRRSRRNRCMDRRLLVPRRQVAPRRGSRPVPRPAGPGRRRRRADRPPGCRPAPAGRHARSRSHTGPPPGSRRVPRGPRGG